MEDKPKELDSIPPAKKRKWLKKRFITLLGNTMPSLVALAAILFAWGQTKENNETNFQIKKFEVTYNERKNAYLDLIQIVRTINNTEFDSKTQKGDDFMNLLDDLLNSAFALSIYLDNESIVNTEVACRQLWESKFGRETNMVSYRNSLDYFYYTLKDILFKN